MTTTVTQEQAEKEPPRSLLLRYYDWHPAYRLAARWALIVALTAFAFHRSLASLIEITREGSIGGYVWTVPMAATLVAIDVARRKRTELPIHDRQTDIIVGIMGMGLAILVQSVLLPRYSLYFYVLRLDLVAMWLFVTCSAVVLFGLRPVIRFAWVWAMLFMVFSLPYYLLVITLGGGKDAAGAATLMLAGVGAGIAGGPTFRRGALASAAAWAVGFAVLGVIWFVFPGAPLLVYQQLPPLIAIGSVGVSMFFLSQRGRPKRVLERRVEPLAAKQVWTSVPLVVTVALALSVFPLPEYPFAPMAARPSPYPLKAGLPLVAPPGWSTAGAVTRMDVDRLYGADAELVRQYVTADAGNPRWDKLSRPRTVVVDSTVTDRASALRNYPARVLYGLTSARISEPRRVELGHGVWADLFSVVDDELLVTWNSLQFVWGTEDLAQRVTILAVDNHDPDAPFPQPTTNLAPTLRTLITLLFRGNDVLEERDPSFKDEEMLRAFGVALVAAQVGPPS
ncbi:hypothetical protein [Mycolicibacterium sp.]|uniref:hypothetical protein n=1 Tax=Mycolicibacterium sp. TaxID=2320850 RepID=UPI003D0EB373